MFMDPSQFGKQYFEEMEKTMVERFTQMLHNPRFLSKMGKGVEAGLDSKKALDDWMKSNLENTGIPTRDDMARVLQYLLAIESRIIGLEEKLDELTDRLDAEKGGKCK